MRTADAIHRFHLANATVRGHLVRLESVWAMVRDNVDCPSAVGELLGESLVAAALLAGALKFDGRLSIQLRDVGPLKLLFAECSNEGNIRGLARCADDSPIQSVDLGEYSAELAITVENAMTNTRYQGRVMAHSARLSTVLEEYFGQSEQLPTRILLATNGARCAGLMLQRVATGDGDAAIVEGDTWNYIGQLLATVSASEILALPAEQLLFRLFHDQGVHLEQGRQLQFHCSCSRSRVADMLRGLGLDEAMSAVRETGSSTITCEFCNRSYTFDTEAIAALFPTQSGPGGPTILN